MKQIKSKVGSSNLKSVVPHSKKNAHVAGGVISAKRSERI